MRRTLSAPFQIKLKLQTATDPGFGQGGGSSDLPEKCVIWAS